MGYKSHNWQVIQNTIRAIYESNDSGDISSSKIICKLYRSPTKQETLEIEKILEFLSDFGILGQAQPQPNESRAERAYAPTNLLKKSYWNFGWHGEILET
jgi:hypothetical protein